MHEFVSPRQCFFFRIHYMNEEEEEEEKGEGDDATGDRKIDKRKGAQL